MTDTREILQLAAKAAGIEWQSYHHQKGLCCRDSKNYGGLIEYYWNPLTDDGDALRLAVKLGIHITVSKYGRTVCRRSSEFLSIQEHGTDPYAATRLAITKAAAEIGRAME